MFGAATGSFTDLYQLTMAEGQLRAGLASRRAAFHCFFRRAPFGGSHTIFAGLEDALDFLARFRFETDDVAYLASLENADGSPLFGAALLDTLGSLELALDVHAVDEGSVVFPGTPLLRVEGPLLHCQLVETGLLAILGFQTLVATKASRMKRAARGAPVVEFGLRRAQGLGAGLDASRAAFIGGADATSNVMAGRRHGIPVRGTHSHAWVMAFDDERAAFRAYGEAMPKGAIFLVDTYDTLRGVENAIAVGREMRARGDELVGIRLDSGDLGALARRARAMLDEAGFESARIVASNDLDEARIDALLDEAAPIDVWGVGTRLVTGWEEPALGIVYKLAALEDGRGVMAPRIKLSESPEKTSLAGRLSARRYLAGDAPVCDVLHLADREPDLDALVDARGNPRPMPSHDAARDLLSPVLERGARVRPSAPLSALRDRALREAAALPQNLARLRDPAPYSVLFDVVLSALRARLVRESRGR